jgi:hypothetical protein
MVRGGDRVTADSFDSPDGRTYSEPVTAVTPGQAMEAPADSEPEEYRLLGWAASLLGCAIPEPTAMVPEVWREAVKNWREAYYAQAATAAQQPQPAGEVAMLRADLADYEALLAKWPKCPAGCSCRLGLPEDADANECGCNGPCNGGEQPAPDLAAAMTETRQLRELAAEIIAQFRPTSDGHHARVGQVQIRKWRARTGLGPL